MSTFNPQEKQEIEWKRREGMRGLIRLQERQRLEAQLMAGQHREDDVPLLAWCKNVMEGCDDTQHPVLGVRFTWNKTYREADPDLPAGDVTASQIESTFVWYDFADAADANCPKCGNRRELGEQERPEYAAVSGYDPKGLIRIAQGWMRDNLRPPMVEGAVFPGVKPDDRVEALEKELAELRALVKPHSASDPLHEGNPAVEVPKPSNGHGPQPDATQGDPPTRDQSWSTVEPNIHVRTRANGSRVYRVKVHGKLHSGLETIEDARQVKETMLGDSS
jgi:hypothetical protein